MCCAYMDISINLWFCLVHIWYQHNDIDKFWQPYSFTTYTHLLGNISRSRQQRKHSIMAYITIPDSRPNILCSVKFSRCLKIKCLEQQLVLQLCNSLIRIVSTFVTHGHTHIHTNINWHSILWVTWNLMAIEDSKIIEINWS